MLSCLCTSFTASNAWLVVLVGIYVQQYGALHTATHLVLQLLARHDPG